VTNIVKHSRATRCVVTIETAPAEVRLQIEDNGIGLSSGKAGSDRLAPPSGDSVAGNGLKGMAERLSLIDGTLTVGAGSLESADGSEAGVGQGTRLQITIPLIVKEAAKEGETA